MTRVKVDAFEDGATVPAGTTGDVFVRDTAHANGGTWQAPGAGGQAFPIGAVFISVVSTNPNTLLGYGTWSAFGAGRVLVGLDATDTDFDLVEETGGAKTSAHAHGAGTLLPDAHPSHAHNTSTSTNMTITAHSGTAVDAHSGTAVSAHSGTAVANHVVTQPSNHASHTHSVGTLVVTDPDTGFGYHTRRHDHEMLEVFQHLHTIASGQGSHQHGMAEGTTDGSGTFMDRSNAASATTAVTDLATLPAMTTTNTGSATARTGEAREAGSATAWDTDHAVSGSTGNESATLTHSGTAVDAHAVTQPSAHSVTQPSNHVVTQPGVHTIGGNTDGLTLPAHTMSGSTGSDSPSVVQPYIVVYMWKRTA